MEESGSSRGEKSSELASVRLFGPPRVEVDGKVQPVLRRKALALLAYLTIAVPDNSHASRDQLCALLWPDLGQSGARQALRTTLAHLREILPDGLVEAERDVVALRESGDIWIDVVEYDAQVARLRPQVLSGAMQPGLEEIDAARRAAEIQIGDFLSGFYLKGCSEFDTWQLTQSSRFQQTRRDLLWLLAQAAIDADQPEEALKWTRRLVTLDPSNEEVHREMMLLLHELGDTAGALNQFELCRRVLRSESNSEPEQQTLELRKEICQATESRRTFSTPLKGEGIKRASGDSAHAEERVRLVSLVAAALDLPDGAVDARNDQALESIEAFNAIIETEIARCDAELIATAPDTVCAVLGAKTGHDDDAMEALRLANRVAKIVAELGSSVRVAVRRGLITADRGRSTGSRLSVQGEPATLMMRQLIQTPVDSVSLCGSTFRSVADSVNAHPFGLSSGEHVYVFEGWRTAPPIRRCDPQVSSGVREKQISFSRSSRRPTPGRGRLLLSPVTPALESQR